MNGTRMCDQLISRRFIMALTFGELRQLGLSDKQIREIKDGILQDRLDDISGLGQIKTKKEVEKEKEKKSK
jgi:hypothetical protein